MSYHEQIETELQTAYEQQLQVLASLSFGQMQAMREILFPFSAIIVFYLYPILKRNGEVFRIESPLRFVVLYPVMTNPNLATFASVISKGVSFTTGFTDGSILVSTNFPSAVKSKPQKHIYRHSPAHVVPVEEVWAEHQARIAELREQGLELQSDLSLEKFGRLIQGRA